MANVKDALGEAVNEHGVIGTNAHKSKVYSDAVKKQRRLVKTF
jgi:hypothetical protein